MLIKSGRNKSGPGRCLAYLLFKGLIDGLTHNRIYLFAKSVRVSALPAELEEQMVQRVLQRVDLMLERRLREAVGQLILEHTQTLVPRLREEIETVVRQSVNQAFEQEIAQTTSLP